MPKDEKSNDITIFIIAAILFILVTTLIGSILQEFIG
jgi:hypothetical protein